MNQIYATKDSIVRFIKAINQVKEGTFLCHQTLTFGEYQFSEKKAKESLFRLLDAVRKRCPQIGVVYVTEIQETGNIHYHVLFFFFQDEHLPCAKEDLVSDFGGYVFKCWKKIQKGKVAKEANEIRVHQKSERTYGYFTQDLRPVFRPERETRWWGIRNRELFDKFGTKPDQKTALAEFWRLFPRGILRPYRKRPIQPFSLINEYVPIERLMTEFSFEPARIAA